jgi:hypothetical protein
MTHIANLAAFGAVALGMVLTPGPNMAYLVSRSVCQGRVAGLVSLAGVALGFLAALLFAVPYAYLAYLAWGALKPSGVLPFQLRELKPDSARRLFGMGLLTSLLNPKICGALSVAPAAIRRSRRRRRFGSDLDARRAADRDQRDVQRVLRPGSRNDRRLSRRAPALRTFAALVHGLRAGRLGGAAGL